MGCAWQKINPTIQLRNFWLKIFLNMPPKKDAKKGDKGEKKDEVKTVEKTEKETLLEAELKKVEDEYKATRQKVNDLRVQNHQLREKTQEIQEERKEYSQFIDKKREKRQNRIISVHDEQQATLKRLEDEDKQAEREHQERMSKLDEEIRLALFKRASQEAAKEAKTQLKIDAHRIIKERTTQARKTNKQLRDQLIKHIDETRVLAVQRKVLESQQRNLQAEIECLKSFQKRN